MFKFLFVFSVLLSLVGCSPKKKAEQGPAKPLILVTIPPYQTLVRELGGEAFDVETVAPSNADPHSFEPTFAQIAPLKKGKVWFRIGESFEKKLLPLLNDTVCLNISQGENLIERDRHLWLSPKQMTSQARVIAQTLSEHFPQEKEAIQVRLEKLELSLGALDVEIAERLKNLSARSFIVSHPAFAYFCRDYHCEQLSVEHEEKEPRPQEIEAFLQEVQSVHPGLAVALPQHNNKGAQAIAERLHIPVRVIDPYDASYTDTIRKLADLLVNPYHSQ
ncbi:MAG TPA: zinc ABC transporter substrate-binding protein [Chlamydiales bacterium]